VSLRAAKKIQVLAIAGRNRIPLMQDVPTMAEEGIHDYEQTFWLAVFGPAGTPGDIIARLNREIAAGPMTDEVKKAFIAQGVETEHSTPEALGEIVRRDVATNAGIERR